MMKTRFFIFTLALIFFRPMVSADDPAYKERREAMVVEQLVRRGITDKRVLGAMRRVPRHVFIPANMRHMAYGDFPVRIGEGQTISQPYIVALMTETLKLNRKEKVLEIGTGSGYQAAVLAELAGEVYSMEIRPALAQRARRTLNEAGYKRVHTRQGDGYFGWKEHGPYDRIMVTAAVDHIPPSLLDQLKEGGRLLLPLGDPWSYQNLVLVQKKNGAYTTTYIMGVLFVPLTGAALQR
jgi:protein-L-isoaspartate(D-aspartate) O-methyltransferase